LREARKLKSAVATDKNIKKEKWLKQTGSFESADLSATALVFLNTPFVSNLKF